MIEQMEKLREIVGGSGLDRAERAEALKGPLTVMSLNEGERVMDALAPLERALPELMSAYHHVRHYMVSDGEDWRGCPRCKAFLEGAC